MRHAGRGIAPGDETLTHPGESGTATGRGGRTADQDSRRDELGEAKSGPEADGDDQGSNTEPTTRAAAGGNSLAVNDPWLPRLKLPPSLEPFEEYTDQALASASATPFTSKPVIEDGDLGEPFRSEYPDDLPPDAGLADLLARALAEHQAGTSSAAALVKRLGSNSTDDRRTVNGHGRNGEPPANGRHRGGDH
ncbi:hypothetical protein [Amycolatopsis pithecellobii]|uniref:Uncharacterized protein n=1 Tax=Amycolatopsis pithecellobii TaxID=664692 RepID=A0A6N7YUU7_9PSEU|nr:hypothetical protein [Amycolatopsis pithecellobii]MTD56847.1 hypothetical protein [Amycolatopsis pithecellobii]